jgi:hypothetical protein
MPSCLAARRSLDLISARRDSTIERLRDWGIAVRDRFAECGNTVRRRRSLDVDVLLDRKRYAGERPQRFARSARASSSSAAGRAVSSSKGRAELT